MIQRVALYALSAFVGVIVVVLPGILGVSSNDQAIWYWSAGFPALIVGSGALGYVRPETPWLWGTAPYVGQFTYHIIGWGVEMTTGNLGPFGFVIVYIGYLLSAVPGTVAAVVAAHLRDSRAR